MDGEALTCNGLVNIKIWEQLDGSPSPQGGELWGGIVPWEDEAQARESYIERTVDDVELSRQQNSTLEEVARVDLGPEWDEGVLLVMEDEQYHYLQAIARDGQWLFFAEVNYSRDRGEEYFADNLDRMTGQTVGDFAYPFEDEALRQWLVDEDIPGVHQTITAKIEGG